MKEKDFTEIVANILTENLSNKYSVEKEKGLLYAHEVREYEESGTPLTRPKKYRTDLLISERVGRVWKPRVVVEVKFGKVTTHDAITYSKKAVAHKSVHPHLRYGFFVGNFKQSGLPGRLLWHGEHFDFMLSWRNTKPADYEKATLIKIIKEEIRSAQHLEEMFFDSQKKDRKQYYAIHKPLIAK